MLCGVKKTLSKGSVKADQERKVKELIFLDFQSIAFRSILLDVCTLVLVCMNPLTRL